MGGVEKPTVQEYWREIVHDAWLATTESQALKARIGEVGLRFVVVGVLVALGAISIALASFLNSAVWGIAAFIGLPFAALALGLVVSFVRNFFYYPAKLHQEQSDQINMRDGSIAELQKKLEHEILHPKIHISGVNANPTKVALRIDNQSGHKVTHLWVTADNPVLKKQNGQAEEKPINESDRGFPHGDYFDEGGAILPSRPVLVHIAEARDGDIVFLLKQDYTFHYTDQAIDTSEDVIKEKDWTLLGVPVGIANYEVRLSVSGYVEDKYFKKRIIGRIHFQKGDMTALTLAQWMGELKELPDDQETEEKAIR